jgi:uncharacterized protein YbjT (DUF2867 family)
LIESGREVRSISRRPAPAGHPLAGEVDVEQLQFGDHDALTRALAGAEVLYATYWVRFPHQGVTFDDAVQNLRLLFRAAEAAGVRKVVYISVSNASAESPYAYFRGKAAAEAALAETSLEWSVIRPTLVFGGREEVLISNISWLLRRLPVYALPGRGRCRVQPVAVQDVAELAARAGSGTGASVLDAAGPEVYRFADFVGLLRDTLHARARLVPIPVAALPPLAAAAGAVLRDVVLTREELGALTAELLVSHAEPTGHRRLSEWLPDQTEWLGRRYVNELRRNWRLETSATK